MTYLQVNFMVKGKQEHIDIASTGKSFREQATDIMNQICDDRGMSKPDSDVFYPIESFVDITLMKDV